MKKDDTNVKSITRDTRDLTPLEKWEEGRKRGAHLMRVSQEIAALLKKLEELEEFSDELPLPYATLEKMADEAIIGLATDLDERYGICA